MAMTSSQNVRALLYDRTRCMCALGLTVASPADVMVMVQNGKPKSQMRQDLEVRFGCTQTAAASLVLLPPPILDGAAATATAAMDTATTITETALCQPLTRALTAIVGFPGPGRAFLR